MDKELWGNLAAVALAIVGVATLSVILSKNSNTVNIASAVGNAFQGSLGAAEAPILGSSYSFPSTSSEFG